MLPAVFQSCLWGLAESRPPESRAPRASPALSHPHSQAASPKRHPPSTAHSPVTARCRAAPGYLSEHRSLKSVGTLGTDFGVREPSLREQHWQ